MLLTLLLGTQHGSTPLHEAASRGQCEVAEVLIAAKANVNANNPVTRVL